MDAPSSSTAKSKDSASSKAMSAASREQENCQSAFQFYSDILSAMQEKPTLGEVIDQIGLGPAQILGRFSWTVPQWLL